LKAQQKSNVLNLRRLWWNLCSHIDSILFPRICACCNRTLINAKNSQKQQKGGLSNSGRLIYDHFLCSKCADTIVSIKPPLCSICGEPFKTHSGPDHICGRCLKIRPHFDIARSIFLYDGAIQTLIHRVKYHGDGFSLKGLSDLAQPFIEIILQEFSPDLICPVPLHDSKLRQRGFNQAAALAFSIFSKNRSKIVPDILIKSKKTAPQVGLSRQERFKNIKNSFSLKKPIPPSVKKILLFDDVFTTGATVSECAKVLKRERTVNVFVITVARAPI